jgi:hypothetical protein
MSKKDYPCQALGTKYGVSYYVYDLCDTKYLACLDLALRKWLVQCV